MQQTGKPAEFKADEHGVLLFHCHHQWKVDWEPLWCVRLSDAWAPLILCSWCSMPNSWRTPYGFYLTLKYWLGSQHGKTLLNTNPLWQKWLQTTKQCSVMFAAFPAVVDDWTVKKWCVRLNGLLKSYILFNFKSRDSWLLAWTTCRYVLWYD